MIHLVCAGFGYCAAATDAFVREAAATGAEVRFSEAVLDVRMQHSVSSPPKVAGKSANRTSLLRYLNTPPGLAAERLHYPLFSLACCDACMCNDLIDPRLVAELVTASGVVQADMFVIAAGLGPPQLARMAGVDVLLADKPATLNVYTMPAPPLLQHMLLSGDFFASEYCSAPSAA